MLLVIALLLAVLFVGWLEKENSKPVDYNCVCGECGTCVWDRENGYQ